MATSTIPVTISDTRWIKLQNDPYIEYRKIDRIVYVRGTNIDVQENTWKTIATMPTGYRPPVTFVFAGICGAYGKTHMAVAVQNGGNINVASSITESDSGQFMINYPLNIT